MAEYGGNPIRKGGYGRGLFVHPPPQTLICGICDSVFFDPVQSMQCTHGFCRSCILNHISKNKNCFICQVGLKETELFPIGMIQSMVKDLVVQCSSAVGKSTNELACNWNGPLSSLDNHLLECSHSLVNCSVKGCETKVLRKDLKAHVNKCPFDKIECDFCNREYQRSDINAHKSQCGMREVSCTNFCEKRMPYVELEFHLVNKCPNQPMPCPVFAQNLCNFDCTGMVPRCELQIHMSKSKCSYEAMQKIIEEKAAMAKQLADRDMLISDLTAERDYTTLRLTVEKLNLKFCVTDTATSMTLPIPTNYLPFHTLSQWVNVELDPVLDHETVMLLNQQLRTRVDLDGNKGVSAHHIEYEGYYKDFDKADKDFHLFSVERTILPGVKACIHVERFKDRMIKFYGKLNGYDGDYDCITSLLRVGHGKPFQGSSKVYGGNYQFCKLKTTSLFEDGFLTREENRIRLLVTFILPGDVAKSFSSDGGKGAAKKQKY